MKLIFLTILLICAGSCAAQDSILYRTIFIGDAGEINGRQAAVIRAAAARILPGKSSVIYLGDNIYPKGMGLPHSRTEKETKDILRSEYLPLRQKGAPVYFIPGNHDWDRSGPRGLEKIRLQGQFLEEQADSLLQLVPANGCPDPVEIQLTPSLVVIAWDSEWWLFPFGKDNEAGQCECKTKKDVLARIEELRQKNSDKTILLASHHPFRSYGPHGGKFTWKDHIFPLTNVNKHLYIPLPLVGSLYPLLRSVILNPEDLKHPLYKNMIGSVSGLFKGFPNITYVAGHEHGLQLINDERLQVVSGSGAKTTNAANGKKSLFANNSGGFVVADQMQGKDMRWQFYVNEGDSVSLRYTYSRPFTPPVGGNALLQKPILEDSLTVRIRPSYNNKSKFFRFWHGENYRREWAAPVTLPVIRISSFAGGLTPLQLGGGLQSRSLRLKDSTGREWVIRSVEKVTDRVLPDALQNTFASDWVDDATSAQHPFSALVVPRIAAAVKVPHSNPVIGVLSPDKNLGTYGKVFDNMIVLLEEREPLGASDNSEKFKKNLQKDNDNSLDGREFLRARMLDVLLGDWDRHEDQWRWYDKSKGKGKLYVGVPRDRDQVFHLIQGVIPTVTSLPALLPSFRSFDYNIEKVKYLLWKTRFVNGYPSFQFSRETWRQQAIAIQQAVPDSVFERALRLLPKYSYDLRHDELLAKLQSRREHLPEAMDRYFRFFQKIIDLRGTDKNERVEVTDAPAGGLRVTMHKINKDGVVKDLLMDNVYEAGLTKELRLYLGAGTDSVLINNTNSAIKLRLMGGADTKVYEVLASKSKIKLYDKPGGAVFLGDSSRFRKRLNSDTAAFGFSPVNLYNVPFTVFTVGVNRDDGLILGASLRYVKQQGFRKFPYAAVHQVSVAHSFSTSAFRVKYHGEWIASFGKADLIVDGIIKAPDNTVNFFGRGNETVFDKTGDYIRFYRTRFSIYQAEPALRWRGAKGSELSVGPSVYLYVFDKDGNAGRFVNNTSAIGSYDSLSIRESKLHLGVNLQYLNDTRSSKILPRWGYYINMKLKAFKGTGSYARDFAQLIPEIAFYKSLNRKATIILAERAGGTIGFGKTAFYQSAFLGGHENLLGYRQYRFAGQHSFYNNLEVRIKVADVANYLLPGQFGITGFWDIGKVWENAGNSGKWHNGTGAGIYFVPASLVSFNFMMGHSSEGWLPYFTMGFRF